MPSDLAILFLSDALAAFTAMHPAVSLELDLSARRVDLLGENVDLAVRIGTPPDDALLAARRVGVFPIGLYAAPSYLAERGDPGSPELLIRLARAGAEIASVPNLVAAPSVKRGDLRRVLPGWCLPPHTVWALFPGRRLMPGKVRAFLDMLVTALPGGAETLTPPLPPAGR